MPFFVPENESCVSDVGESEDALLNSREICVHVRQFELMMRDPPSAATGR